MQQLRWPEDFYCGTGVNVENEEIQKWIDELLNSEDDYGYIRSGNTVVVKCYDVVFVCRDPYIADLLDVFDLEEEEGVS
ncbi:MAG: hypothetical protein AB7E45_07090 [Candidatus Caldatribacteriota bacterium]